MERQDKLALRKGDSTAFVRTDTVNEETLNGYFDLIEDNLQNSPSHISKTGVPLESKAPKLVVPKGIKKLRY